MKSLVFTSNFSLSGIEQEVELCIWRDDDDNKNFYTATASHAIKRPEQLSGDVPQPLSYSKSPEEAAESVIGFYRGECARAIEDGHKPSLDWLVKEEQL
jgi:hypothetical protein